MMTDAPPSLLQLFLYSSTNLRLGAVADTGNFDPCFIGEPFARCLPNPIIEPRSDSGLADDFIAYFHLRQHNSNRFGAFRGGGGRFMPTSLGLLGDRGPRTNSCCLGGLGQLDERPVHVPVTLSIPLRLRPMPFPLPELLPGYCRCSGRLGRVSSSCGWYKSSAFCPWLQCV